MDYLKFVHANKGNRTGLYSLQFFMWDIITMQSPTRRTSKSYYCLVMRYAIFIAISVISWKTDLQQRKGKRKRQNTYTKHETRQLTFAAHRVRRSIISSHGVRIVEICE